MSEELCTNCGAPRAAGYAACKFCKTPFAGVGNTQTNAIPCPRCATLNEMGAQKCVQCQTWVVVQCVFCHALSPHNSPACMHCSEAFAGAPERFAARQSQQRLETGLHVAGTVGNVAASFLGAAAGAGLFSGHHQHHHHQQYGNQDGGSWSDNSGGGNIGVEQGSGGGGGFFDSLFGGSSSSSDGNISTESGDSGGGIFGGSSSSSSDDSGGGFFGSSDDDDS